MKQLATIQNQNKLQKTITPSLYRRKNYFITDFSGENRLNEINMNQMLRVYLII